MLVFLCKLWPYLAGGLVGWLLCGWFARRLKYGHPPVEKIIENTTTVDKIVDNPEHLSLIAELETENTQITELKSIIANFENTEPEVVEKIVELEKVVEVEKIIEKPVEKIVEKEVVKNVDNPLHLTQIKSLESELESLKRGTKIDIAAAKAAGIALKAEDDFTAIEGVGPKINDLIHADGIKTFAELSNVETSRLQTILDKAGANFKMADPGTWTDQAYLASNNRWSALKTLQDILDGGVYPDTSAIFTDKTIDNPQHIARIEALENQIDEMSKGTVVDVDKAKAAGFKYKNQENIAHADFTVIEGIGPKIDELIHGAGIHTYKALSLTRSDDIQKILDSAGSNFKLAKPGTWPAQSGLASNNQWKALRAWQDVLDGGEE